MRAVSHLPNLLLALALALVGSVAAAADSPSTVPVLSEGGKLATEATRKTDFHAFGFGPAELAVLDDATLLERARMDERRAEMMKLAQQGNAYAQFLLGLRPGQEDDLVMIGKAADQGLLRAIAVREATYANRKGPDREERLRALRKLADQGIPYAMYAFGLLGNEADSNARFAAIMKAAELGFNPALVYLAQQMLNESDPEIWDMGHHMAYRAALMGDAEAKVLLDKYPDSARPVKK